VSYRALACHCTAAPTAEFHLPVLLNGLHLLFILSLLPTYVHRTGEKNFKHLLLRV